MSKGGARARSGPPPDPNALTAKEGDWLVLPAEGRQGPPPPWPLEAQAEREAVLWEREWRRPQAVEWERQGQELEVALYVRTVLAAESPLATAATRTLVKQQMEALGISVPGLLRNRWKIGEAKPAHPASSASSARPRRASTRDRFTVVAGGA